MCTLARFLHVTLNRSGQIKQLQVSVSVTREVLQLLFAVKTRLWVLEVKCVIEQENPQLFLLYLDVEAVDSGVPLLAGSHHYAQVSTKLWVGGGLISYQDVALKCSYRLVLDDRPRLPSLRCPFCSAAAGELVGLRGHRRQHQVELPALTT
jgi:hypothetical protein